MIPRIIAHRGGAFEAPENTMTAFDRAIAIPADGFETDVRMTLDGQLVLYHDETLYKICMRRKRISELTLEELIAVDCGKWFALKFAGEKIPTFSEFLDRFAGRTQLMIEIKSDKRVTESGRSLKLTAGVIGELKKPDRIRHRDTFYILSFDPDVLKYAAQMEPDFRYVLNLSDIVVDPTGASGILKQAYADISHLAGICVKEKFLSETLTDFAHGSGKELMTYSVNTHRQLTHSLNMKADVLMTDRPGWLKNVLKTKGIPS